jgi:uncharacterized peroxidase-related enzyme
MPQPDHLVKLDLPETPDLTPELEAYFAKCLEKIGFVPNVLKAYTMDVTKLSNFAAFYNTLMLAPSGLTKLEREMVAVTVSSANRCYYCLVAHGQAVRQLSNDPELGEMMVMNYRVADLAPRQRAMLDYAWKLTVTPWEIGDADRERLRAAGLSDKDIFDLTDVAAFFNYTNRMAHGTDMMPNRDYHTLNRGG